MEKKGVGDLTNLLHTSGRNMEWDSWNWHMIMCRLRIQKIKIGNWVGFELGPFFSLFLMRKRLSSGQKWFLRPYFPLRGMFVLRSGHRFSFRALNQEWGKGHLCTSDWVCGNVHSLSYPLFHFFGVSHQCLQHDPSLITSYNRRKLIGLKLPSVRSHLILKREIEIV